VYTRLAMILGFAAVLGCAPRNYTYVPVTTTSAEIAGERSAVYAIPRLEPHGTVRVEAFGIAPLRHRGLDDTTMPCVRVMLVVTNQSDEAWIVDGDEQQLALGWSGRELVSATTAEVERAPRIAVPPRSMKWIDLYFPLPARVASAREVPAFDVLWTVRMGDRVITEQTPFARIAIAPEMRAPAVTTGPESIPGAQQLPGTEPPNRWPPPHPSQ